MLPKDCAEAMLEVLGCVLDCFVDELRDLRVNGLCRVGLMVDGRDLGWCEGLFLLEGCHIAVPVVLVQCAANGSDALDRDGLGGEAIVGEK